MHFLNVFTFIGNGRLCIEESESLHSSSFDLSCWHFFIFSFLDYVRITSSHRKIKRFRYKKRNFCREKYEGETSEWSDTVDDWPFFCQWYCSWGWNTGDVKLDRINSRKISLQLKLGLRVSLYFLRVNWSMSFRSWIAKSRVVSTEIFFFFFPIIILSVLSIAIRSESVRFFKS